RPLPDPAPSGASSPESAFSLGLPELEPEPDLIAPGAATRPADDSISLDQVFGDEGPRAAPQAPDPPRPPAATGGFSFDQFFGTPAPSAAPPGGSVAPASPAAQAPPRAPRPAEDEGDLDQFQAWLKGLKA